MGSTEERKTRKERRESARRERRAAEQAQASAGARRRRLIQLGSVLAAVVVIIAAIVAVTSSGGGKKPPTIAPASSAGVEARKTVESELNGIPQAGTRLGRATAPVTMQYFGDLECPICRDFTLGALPGLIQKDVRTGKLQIEYRSLSTATSGAESRGAEPTGMFATQQVAAYAAGKQNRAWYYIELFYREQKEEDSGYVTQSFLQSLGAQVPGLNIARWQKDRGEKALENQVYEDERVATKAGFEGTPSFMLGRSGGAMKPFQPADFTESSAFEPAIEKLAS